VKPISVLIVDDHAVFADAVQARLSAEPDLTPVTVAYGVRQALQRMKASAPDVAIVDLTLGDGSGLDVADEARSLSPGTRIVMLSAADSLDAVVDSLTLGVRGWLPKTIDTEQLIAAVRGVCAGEAWLSPGLLGRVLARLLTATIDPPPEPLAVLTPREREVLDCIAGGLNRGDTAARLGVSINTVRSHTQNLIAKLGVHSTLEAVAMRNRMAMDEHRLPMAGRGRFFN